MLRELGNSPGSKSGSRDEGRGRIELSMKSPVMESIWQIQPGGGKKRNKDISRLVSQAMIMIEGLKRPLSFS